MILKCVYNRNINWFKLRRKITKILSDKFLLCQLFSSQRTAKASLLLKSGRLFPLMLQCSFTGLFGEKGSLIRKWWDKWLPRNWLYPCLFILVYLFILFTFNFIFTHMGIHFLQHHFLEMLSFLWYVFLTTLLNIMWSWVYFYLLFLYYSFLIKFIILP